MLGDGVLRKLAPDETVDYTKPYVAFVVGVEEHPRLVVEVGGDYEVDSLFNWVARPGILDELATMVDELRDAVADLDDNDAS